MAEVNGLFQTLEVLLQNWLQKYQAELISFLSQSDKFSLLAVKLSGESPQYVSCKTPEGGKK